VGARVLVRLWLPPGVVSVRVLLALEEESLWVPLCVIEEVAEDRTAGLWVTLLPRVEDVLLRVASLPLHVSLSVQVELGVVVVAGTVVVVSTGLRERLWVTLWVVLPWFEGVLLRVASLSLQVPLSVGSGELLPEAVTIRLGDLDGESVARGVKVGLLEEDPEEVLVAVEVAAVKEEVACGVAVAC
jgi:hypothetical protein